MTTTTQEVEQNQVILDYISLHEPKIREWVELTCLTHSQLVEWFLRSIESDNYEIIDNFESYTSLEISGHSSFDGTPQLFEFPASIFFDVDH